MTNITIGEWLKMATARLTSAQAEGALDAYCQPRRDSEVLLSYVILKNTAFMRAFDETVLIGSELELANEYLTRRETGEPIAYILGEKEFWSMPFKVSPATLIPRPDTECLVEIALGKLGDGEFNILDLGTGTGAIAIALASERASWKITGVDVNPEAIKLANENKQRLADFIKNMDKLEFLTSNWFSVFAEEPLKSNGNEITSMKMDRRDFDLIVSNPPYIDVTDKHLSCGDVKYEPSTALIADAEGLADIQHIVAQSRTHLKRGGWLIVEHGWQQAEAVQRIMALNHYEQVESFHDLNGQLRVTAGCYL